MAIAKHPVLSKSAHGPTLPPSWRSLYELTKVEPKRLTAAFKDGEITPDMSRKALTDLLPPAPKRPRARQPSLPDILVPAEPASESIEDEPFDPDTAVLQVVHLIRSTAASWPDTVSLDVFVRNLRFEADRLAKRQERLAS